MIKFIYILNKKCLNYRCKVFWSSICSFLIGSSRVSMLLEMTGWLSWGGNSWLKLTEDNEGGIKAGKLGEEIEGALLEYPKEGGEEKADDCSPLCFYEIKEENFYWPLSVAREDAKTVTDEAAGVHMARAEEFMLRRKF